MADNPTPGGAEGWYDPSQWADPVTRLNFTTTGGPVEVPFTVEREGDELYIDGARFRNPAGIYVAHVGQLTARHRLPTRRQRIGALVRRVLRRKAGA